jgi:hypothetical protein
MTWLSVLSGFLRFIGLVQWADKAWEAHEAKLKAREVSNAIASDNRKSDADIADELRSKYSRD